MNEVFETEKTKTTQDDTKERQVSSSILDVLEKHGNVALWIHIIACWAFWGFVSYRHLFLET